MKTSTITTFFNTLGITTETLDQTKGLIELPFLNGLVVAVSDDTEGQLKATNKFREVSSKNKTLVASCVPMYQPGGSTIVPGIGCRVPVMTVYSGRHEDTFGTNGHLITNNRLMVLMKEMGELSTKARAKTPYLSWLCQSMGVHRPRTLKALQELIVEASEHEASKSIPAIAELQVGRGTRHAVLTVRADVEYRDTEPTVNESDWIFVDLERLVLGGITDTQASVLRKTAEAFDKAVAKKQMAVAAPANQEGRQAVKELMAA
jgi:hypothetical protein